MMKTKKSQIIYSLIVGFSIILLAHPTAVLRAAQEVVSITDTAEQLFVKLKHDRSKLKDFLVAMPKGGVLHMHFGGEIDPDLQIDIARDQDYYLRIDQSAIGMIGLSGWDASFKIISRDTYRQRVLPEHRDKFQLVRDWLKQNPDGRAVLRERLTMQYEEPIDEFFDTIWIRKGELFNRELFPIYLKHVLERAHEQAISYLELRESPFSTPDTSLAEAKTAVARWAQAVDQTNKQWPPAERVEVRYVVTVHRGRPTAPAMLEKAFALAASDDADERDLVVGVDLLGLENTGPPTKFIRALRQARARYPNVHLTMHAGESNIIDSNVRDSILLGAERIGHGANMAQDKLNAMDLAKENDILIEVSLISNYLLLKRAIKDHPIKTYLSMGIPVSLNTDDGGIFNSTMTDEFLEAAATLDIGWQQLRRLCENSLLYSFARADDKQELLTRWRSRWQAFEVNPQKRWQK
jgi:adenosine deaminase CECR1